MCTLKIEKLSTSGTKVMEQFYFLWELSPNVKLLTLPSVSWIFIYERSSTSTPLPSPAFLLRGEY
jgi:hypothetical protein